MSKHSLPIVVIHGVGCPEYGAEIQELRKAIGGVATDERVEVGGFVVPTAVVGHGSTTAKLYEVNWTDVARPREGLVGVLLFFVRLQLGLVQIAEAGWSDKRGPSAPSFIGRLFRYVTIGGALWAVLLPTSVLLALVVRPTWLASLFLLALFALTATVARALARDDKIANLGYVWGTGAFALGMSLLALDLPEKTIIIYAARFSGGVETLSGILLLIGMAEAWLRFFFHSRDSLVSQALVRSASYILPFSILVGGLGSLIIACNLWLTQSLEWFEVVNKTRLDNVLTTFASASAYNIPFMEVVNGTATFAALISIVLAALLWGGALRLGLVKRLQWGNVFRTILMVWCALLVVLTLIVFIAFLVDLSDISPRVESFDLNTIALVGLIVSMLSTSGAPATPIEIYKYSALRLTPTIMSAIPGLRDALDRVADVLFYLLPTWSRMSTAELTKSRLRKCIEFAQHDSNAVPTVLAYSQGSRIAVDLIKDMPETTFNLVTIGSPVGVLHGAILGLPEDGLDGRHTNVRWTNFYRDSDFIGGPVNNGIVKNRLIESGFSKSHFDYYLEPALLEFLLARGDAVAAAAAG